MGDLIVAVPAAYADPKIETWPAGRRITRAFAVKWGPVGFNASETSMRFRPIYDDAGAVIPTLYGAQGLETALAEVLLRGKDGSTVRQQLFMRQVEGIACVELSPTRDLSLVSLHGAGLRRLKLQRSGLIDTPESNYPHTARISQHLHDCPAAPDGLVWTSLQNDSDRALMLFGDRVAPGVLTAVNGDAGVVALDREPGLTLVRAACLDSAIDFEG